MIGIIGTIFLFQKNVKGYILLNKLRCIYLSYIFNRVIIYIPALLKAHWLNSWWHRDPRTMHFVFSFLLYPQANTYLRNWLLAVLGSPTMQTFISPRREVPSPVVFGTPPKSINRTPRFTSSLPETKTQQEVQCHRKLQRHVVYQPEEQRQLKQSVKAKVKIPGF